MYKVAKKRATAAADVENESHAAGYTDVHRTGYPQPCHDVGDQHMQNGRCDSCLNGQTTSMTPSHSLDSPVTLHHRETLVTMNDRVMGSRGNCLCVARRTSQSTLSRAQHLNELGSRFARDRRIQRSGTYFGSKRCGLTLGLDHQTYSTL